MGHRANFVIIRDASASAFYDQWAALGCAFVLADGPEAAAGFAAQMAPADELLDWAFAEGGYLIDLDARTLIAFGPLETEFDAEDLEGLDLPESEIPVPAIPSEPHAFLAHIAARWPGWLLRWDDRGVDAFAAYLAEKGVGGIKTQPPSHPEGREAIEHQA
jgi:hypothetical protein